MGGYLARQAPSHRSTFLKIWILPLKKFRALAFGHRIKNDIQYEYPANSEDTEEDQWIQSLSQIDLGEPLNSSLGPIRQRNPRQDLSILPFFNSTWEDDAVASAAISSHPAEDQAIAFSAEQATRFVQESLRMHVDGMAFTSTNHDLPNFSSISDDGWVELVKALVNEIPRDAGMGPMFISGTVGMLPYVSCTTLKRLAHQLWIRKPEGIDDVQNFMELDNGVTQIDSTVGQSPDVDDEDVMCQVQHVTSTSTQMEGENKTTPMTDDVSNPQIPGPELIDEFDRIKNTCIVLGSLAHKFAGLKSEILFTEEVQDFLLSLLRDQNGDPGLILCALVALGNFAETRTSKVKISASLALENDLLGKFEAWRYSEDHIQAQIGFCAQWLLDNVFAAVAPGREFGCCSVDACNNYVILDTEDTSEDLRISPDGLEARHDGSKFQSARTTACAFLSGMDLGVWYYEAELVSDAIMQIGWATNKCSFADPENGVGDDYFSVGYDGRRKILWYNGVHQTLKETPTWKSGDIVGTILDFKRSVVHFYLNGTIVASATQILEAGYAQGGFYGAASLGSFQQCKFNFGNKPFRHSPPNPYERFECFNNYAARLGSNCRIVIPRHIRLANFSEINVVEKENACILCFDNSADVRILPCMHAEFCSTCLSDLCICPLCRGDIQEKQPLVQLESLET